MTDLFASLTGAAAPLTLARVADGFLPLLLADLARASDTRLLFIAPDESAMQGICDAARYFAPELDCLRFPAWDCLPYDRSSPSMRASAERLATLAALQLPPRRGTLIVTTAGAIAQRTLTPFRVRQISAALAAGTRIDRDKLIMMLSANGYARTDAVADQGEFAVRGSIIDLFPAGESTGIRVDFFGDEIETIRRFDPADQRSLGGIDRFALLPVSEALLDDDSIRRFRTGYRDHFGAASTGDPLYQAVSAGRRQSGMEHWLPLFEERLVTLFDHIDPATPVLRAHRSDAAITARFDAIADYHANRSAAEAGDQSGYRPLAPETLYLTPAEWRKAAKARPIHLVTPHAVAEASTVIDVGTIAARDFTAERARCDNVYAAVAAHAAEQRASGRRMIIAS
ncbi:MAG: hypothetical protein RLZZ58_1578, partial [Pseudomonadota bacterium]